MFGKTTAIPEIYKREIQTLLAQRYQTAKEAWRQRVFDCQSRINDFTTWRKNMSASFKAMIEKVSSVRNYNYNYLND